jgi:lipopolysaccharide export system protein LptC
MHKVIRIIRMVWERLSMYLPMLLMGVLAMGTYWLVRSTPIFATSPVDQPLQHEYDYFMERFSVKTFDVDGQLKNEILGLEARHFPDTDTMEIEQVRIVNYTKMGHMTTATANRAVTNGDGSEVQLIGNAQVVREAVVEKSGQEKPRMSLRSEFLHVYLETERVKSHKPVELTRGNDQFTAESMEFDNLDQVMQLQGRVRGTLEQKQAR